MLVVQKNLLDIFKHKINLFILQVLSKPYSSRTLLEKCNSLWQARAQIKIRLFPSHGIFQKSHFTRCTLLLRISTSGKTKRKAYQNYSFLLSCTLVT